MSKPDKHERHQARIRARGLDNQIRRVKRPKRVTVITLPADVEMILACVPVLNPENHAYAVRVGLPANVPWLKPYPGSARGVCFSCGGDIWIGPKQQAKLAAEPTLPTVCHICALIVAHTQGDDLNMTTLGPDETSCIPGHEMPPEWLDTP